MYTIDGTSFEQTCECEYSKAGPYLFQPNTIVEVLVNLQCQMLQQRNFRWQQEQDKKNTVKLGLDHEQSHVLTLQEVVNPAKNIEY